MGDDPGIFYDYEPMNATLPEEAFDVTYPAKGNSELADKIAKQLEKYGFKPVLERRSFDHSVYVSMKFFRPDVDIPIVQISVLLKGKDEAESTDLNFKLGEAE